jgi:hypothetical protein
VYQYRSYDDRASYRLFVAALDRYQAFVEAIDGRAATKRAGRQSARISTPSISRGATPRPTRARWRVKARSAEATARVGRGATLDATWMIEPR